MKLEELLKQYRAENKISQRELARRCDLSNSLISLFEMGKNPQTGKQMSPDMETYKKLADGMGVSVHSLFEKLGNDATVNILPVQKIRKPFGKVIAGKVDEKVEKFFVEEHYYEPDIEIDPQYASMMKLWKVATPKARKAAMEVLRVMSDADE
jgi:transcriptional regulator with XRE-family HTH domain